jgi:ABC-type nitrate/sulfonate/bicarbonate transport system substrate-binding protein
MTDTINAIVFPGGFNLPLWTAEKQGFFAKRALDVRLHPTQNSMEQLTGLVAGKWDIALTSFDNVAAYQEGQGEAALDREPDLFAFMGGDNAFLRLVVQPGIASYDDLKGKTLAVDAMTTGFAFVLRKMLTLNGIKESEVTFERADGTMQRWEAMKAGKYAATILRTPFDLMAERIGLRVLQHASSVFHDYQGIVGAARRGWARDNKDVLARFIRAYLDALTWLFVPANRQGAMEILRAGVPNMTPELASAVCDVFLGAVGGFEREAHINVDGMRQVLKLRSEYGQPQKNLAVPEKYFDLSYYRAASELVP